jgi:hypothetical protein
LRLLTATLPADHDLVLLGDTHYGTMLRHEDGINQAIDQIRGNKNTWACFMGDSLEGIVFDDPRYDPETIEDAIPIRQAKAVIRDFRTVQKNLLVWLLGNHEMKLAKFGNLSKFIADELGVPYGTYSSVLSVFDKKNHLMYRLYLAHGFGTIDSKLFDPFEREHAMKRALKRQLFLKVGHCQIMACGHTHRLLVKPPTRELYLNGEDDLKQQYTCPEIYNGDYIHPDLRWYVNTGSFYKLFSANSEGSGYAERMGLNPNVLGYSIVEVRNKQVSNIRPVIL